VVVVLCKSLGWRGVGRWWDVLAVEREDSSKRTWKDSRALECGCTQDYVSM